MNYKRTYEEAFGLLPWQSQKYRNIFLSDTPSAESLLSRKFTDQRSLGEIEAEELHREQKPIELLDQFPYVHPVPSHNNIALGNEKKPPRSDITVAMHLRAKNVKS